MGVVETNKKGTTFSRIVGPAVAGALELAVFHPVDTVAKRLMSHEGSIRGSSNPMGAFNEVIFRKHAQSGFFTKWKSLFPGLGFGAGYKITQRVYKFGGQPFVVDVLKGNCSGLFDTFGAYSGVVMKVLIPIPTPIPAAMGVSAAWRHPTPDASVRRALLQSSGSAPLGAGRGSTEGRPSGHAP